MSDNITLPREVVELALEVVELALEVVELSSGGEPIGTMERKAIAALRTALAAEQPKHDLMKWAKDAGSSPEDLERFATYTIATRDMEIATLREENEALRRDAERYRYLRDKAYVWDSDMPKAMRPVALWLHADGNANIDAAIDAAMENKR